MLLSVLRVLNLGLLTFWTGVPDEPLIGPERVQLVFHRTEGQVAAKFIGPTADRWVRLLGSGTVRVNGTLVPTRPQDQASGSIALTPFLRRGENLLEAENYSGPAELEITPRVFLTARRQGEVLAVLVENTLANACNVEVTVGQRPQNAYIPPESMVALEFSAPRTGSLDVRLYKFPEALEEGYTFRLQVP